ncbi:MAG: isoprenylcysteine carboxylmethyltransferase family protein [Candidatus Aminicenantes bacterium]|nr:isoprenylcysteine carboxylmethyltransferase family protein [Candidatus Aminicenantes bacterium]
MTTLDTNKKSPHRHGAGDEHPLGHLGGFIGLAVFLAVWTLDSFVFRVSIVPAAVVPLPLRIAAAALFLALAAYFSLKGHAVFEVDPERSDRPVQEGVFARVRHPIYLGILLFYFSLVLSTLSLLALAVLAGIVLFFNAIASYEEARLVEIFGDAYRDYRRRVPKWIPRLRPAASSPTLPAFRRGLGR